MRNAGLEAGERVTARADGPGRCDPRTRGGCSRAQFAGSLTGVYEGETLDQLRDEWRLTVIDAGVLIGFLDESDAHHDTSTNESSKVRVAEER